MSNLGRWQAFYDSVDRGIPFGYDDSPVFAHAAWWMEDCEVVADWGCGGGHLRRFIDGGRYLGVDGSSTWAVDVVADLEDYHGRTDGIFMRGVLEHNYRWETVLANALAAFKKRMALVFFTAWHEGPEEFVELAFEEAYGVPTLAFRRDAIEARLEGFVFDYSDVDSMHHVDHVFLIERPDA